MLWTEQNTERAEKMVRAFAAAKFGRGKARPWFEHGQWWVIVDDPPDGEETIYSVVDCQAEGIDYLDFEEV